MENLTSDEKGAIEELRRRVQNDITKEMRKDETLYYRFLKARDFKVNLAESMLRKHITWRIANQVDTILTDYKQPEVLTKYFSYCFLGYDKEGHPVYYHTAGKMNIEGLLKCITFSEIKRHMLYEMEQGLLHLKKQNEKLKKNLMQGCCIYNLEFLTLAESTKKKNIELVLLLINLLQDHYPERMKTTYVINAPSFFAMIFPIVKKCISNSMIHKLQVFGSEGWKETLANTIDVSNLPAFLGGLKTDPDGDPYCHTFIVHGSIIPERYFRRNCKKPLSEIPNAIRLKIPERSKSEVPLVIHEEDSIIKWEYETANGDIGFGLVFQENQSEVTQLIPVEKFQIDEVPETGMFRCDKKGTYILIFDNSHSWLQSNELYYTVTVVNSKNEKMSIPR